MADIESVVKGLNDIGAFIASRLGYEQARNYFKTIDDAIALLNEQEAVKPLAKEDDSYECVCGAIVGWDELDASGIVQTRLNYCPFCGKPIDWEGR